ncbi:MAG: 3'(2'),5'-bisphosphate nucleotidase [Deltaproteobacteria bacterium]|nr:3'(2'),5'-bisphosphate nucleotidase [Deltaproteobacteria bacterium]
MHEMERRAAIEAVVEASSLGAAVQSNLLSTGAVNKEDRSPVTVADFGVQALISDMLATSFPDVPLVSEEDSELLRNPDNENLKDLVVAYVRRYRPTLTKESEIFKAIDRGKAQGGGLGRFWALDPIDGTKGFLRGGQYVVALALIEEGQVTLGVMGCPNLPLHSLQKKDYLGCVFAAVKGEGSYCRGFDEPEEIKISVSSLSDPADALFCESFEPSHSSHDQVAHILELLGAKRPPLRMDSQGKYGLLARGEGTVYLRLPTRESYEEKIWDHAAGTIIVEEAGGRVTDLRGKPLDFSRGRTLNNNKGIVATNGLLHERVLQAVKAVSTGNALRHSAQSAGKSRG